MIEILNKEECCGCSACKQKCPKNCIVMKEDEEGFVYPFVQKELCINCGACERVCPVINKIKGGVPLKAFAAYNENCAIRLKSSSGGIFSLFAEKIINEGGTVFGACFDNNGFSVKHVGITEIKDIELLRGAKYAQSDIGESYKKVEELLKQGKKVLFSGTPCQVSGLRLFLRREYINLVTVEVVCHGVPSPMIWRQYLESVCKEKKNRKT